MESQFKVYLEQFLLPGKYHPRRAQLIALGLAFFALSPLILTFFPLSELTRIALFDQILFFELPQRLNWIILGIAVNALYFHLIMQLRPCASLLHFLYQIIYQKDSRFFLRKKMKYKQKTILTYELAMIHIRRFFNVMNYFVNFKYFLLFFYNANGIIRICQHYRTFLFSYSVLWRLPLYLLASLGASLKVVTYANLHMIFGSIGAAFTVIAFLQFQQINHLLAGSHCTLSRLNLFTRRHTELLRLIFAYNGFFGKLLSAFMALNFPTNTFFTIGLLMGAFPPLTSAVFLNLAVIQYLALVFFHVLSAMYSNRIHKCRCRLFHFNATGRRLAFHEQLKQIVYLEKFNSKAKYGITYASLGMVSFESFFKFVILYSELVLYWYTLFEH